MSAWYFVFIVEAICIVAFVAMIVTAELGHE